MKNLRIIMLIIMSLCMKSLCVTTIDHSSEQGQKIKANLDEAARKQEERKAQEAEEARKQEEARKETQQKIDELKVQEETAQKEREAEKRKKMEESPRHIMDALGDLFTAAKKYAAAEGVTDAKARDENIKSGNVLFKKFGQELYDALNVFPSEKVKENISIIVKKMELKPENRFMILRDLIEAYGAYPKAIDVDHVKVLVDFIEVLFNTFSSNELQTIASEVKPEKFNPTMRKLAYYIAAINNEEALSESLFKAIRQFSEHVIATTTDPSLLFYWFNTVPFESPLTEAERKNKKDPHFELKKLIERIDFTKLPDNVHPEIYRRWIDFFKKNLKTVPPAQLVSKYLESLVSSISLAELSKEVEFLKSDITQDFLEKNSKLMKSFIKKYVELLKAGGTFHDYRLAIETFGKGMDFADLIDVQFGLLGKLEEHPDWLKTISGSKDQVKLDGDQKFLADMMKEMTDKQLPKSATALFNLIKTVKSVIDDSKLGADQKERLIILSDQLANDIVPNLAWTQRWSGKISSFFDTYLPWWGKNKTYKPHWISWPQEKRLMIYGLTKDESEHEQQLSYVKKDDKDRYRPEYYPGPEYGSYYKKRFLSHESGEKALNRLLEIRDLYPKERYGDVQQALENDAREIFGRIFEYDKIFNFIKNDIKKQELFFSFKQAPSLGSYYQTVGRYGEKHVGEYERSADVLISDFHSGLEDETLSFDKISDDVFSRIIDTYLIDISKKAGLMSDHQFAMFISELGKNRVDAPYSIEETVNARVNALVTAYRNVSKEKQPLFSKAAIQYLNNSAKTVGKDKAQQAVKSFKEQAARPA